MRISDWSSDVCSSGSLHVKLGNGRPVGILLDAITDLLVGQDIDALVIKTEVIENLDDLPGETALGKLRSALHEEDNIVRLYFIGDEFLNSAHLMILVCPGSSSRSEERRVGKECFSTCRSRGA